MVKLQGREIPVVAAFPTAPAALTDKLDLPQATTPLLREIGLVQIVIAVILALPGAEL
jgi:hypothetical protein